MSEGIRIRVKLFGIYRNAMGGSQIERRVESGATVEDLWRELATECEGLDAQESVRLNSVNLDFAEGDHVLSDGDEVAFFPPVSGG